MRPIELQITGLNSFRERQTILFQPLLAEGLFGIFGPTGSGKSSILDAITLALYGEVKRAPKGKGGIINMQEKSCSVSFTFEVLVDEARKRYTIERLIEREKKKGGVTTKRARLSEHRNGEKVPIAEKEKELDGKIQELIGIGAEDFLRAVILPQGAFANLLNLKPAERGEVMQRLFGLHDLGERLRLQLTARSAQIENLRAGQGGRISELRAFDDSIVAAALESMQRAEVEKEATRKQFGDVEQRVREMEALQLLLNEQAELLRLAPERELERERLDALRIRIDGGERSRGIEPSITAAEDSARRHRASEEHYKTVVAAQALATKKSEEARDRFARIKVSYDADYEALGETLIALRRIRSDREALERLNAELAELRSACDVSADEQQRRQQEHGQQAEEVRQWELRIEELDRKRRALRLPPDERERIDRLRLLLQNAERANTMLAEKRSSSETLRGDLEKIDSAVEEERKNEHRILEEISTLSASIDIGREALVARQTDLERHRDHYQQIRNLQTIIEAAAQRLGGARGELASSRSDATLLEADRHRDNVALDSAIEERRLSLERLEGARQHLAEAERDSLLTTLAASLLEGTPCPLCGSAHHPHPHEISQEGSHTLDRLKRELSNAERAYTDADARRNAAGERAAMLQTKLMAARDMVLNMEERVAVVEREITQQIAAADASRPISSPDDLRVYAMELLGTGQSVRAEVDRLRGEHEQLESRTTAAREAQYQVANRLAGLASDRANKQDRLSLILHEMDALIREISEISIEIDRDSGGATREAIAAMIADSIAGDREAGEIELALAENTLRLRQASAERDTAAATLTEAMRTHDTNLARAAQLSTDLERRSVALRTDLHTLLPPRDHDSDIATLIRTREEQRERLRSDFDEARRDYETAHTDATIKETEVTSCWKTLCADELERDRRAQELTSLLLHYGFATVEAARMSLVEHGTLLGMKEEAAEIDRELRGVATREVELRALLQGRTLNAQEADELRNRYETARTDRDAAIAAHGAAEQHYHTCLEKNHELHQALAEQQGVEERAATIEQLRRYLVGNAFVNYLADERLVEVCRRASFQLESLTGGRLELCSRSSDGFFIRDHGNGGGERATTSLSGGETFLVSLALALALSDTIQLGKSPLEFFFLDEGFGTLDQDLLETVLDSLEKLRSQHRAIGVISHVGSLRERINRRLMVSPATEGHGSVVTCEVT